MCGIDLGLGMWLQGRTLPCKKPGFHAQGSRAKTAKALLVSFNCSIQVTVQDFRNQTHIPSPTVHKLYLPLVWMASDMSLCPCLTADRSSLIKEHATEAIDLQLFLLCSLTSPIQFCSLWPHVCSLLSWLWDKLTKLPSLYRDL